MPKYESRLLGDKLFQNKIDKQGYEIQSKYRLVQTDYECREIQQEFRLKECPTMALRSNEPDSLHDIVWVSYDNAPWELDAEYIRVHRKTYAVTRKTYKDNPLFEISDKAKYAMMNALLRDGLQQYVEWRRGYEIIGPNKIVFEVHHLYGSTWFHEKACTLFCEIHGENLVVMNVTTPNSKWDMREENRKMIGRSVKWKEYISG